MDPNAQNLPTSTPPPAPFPEKQSEKDPNQLQPPEYKEPPPEKPKSNKKIIVVAALLILVLVLTLVSVAAFTMMDNTGSEQEDTPDAYLGEDMEAEPTPIAKTPTESDMSDWLTYTDSGNYFSVKYPPDYFVIPLEGNTSDIGGESNIDVNCVYISDTDDMTKLIESDTVFLCYGQVDLNKIYPEIPLSENYEEVDINGYVGYKKIADDGDLFKYKYYIADGTEGFVTFDTFSPDDELLEKVVASLKIN